MESNLTKSFAEAIIAVGSRPLSEADIEQIRKLVLDYTGVIHRGSNLPWVRAMVAWASRYDGSGRARIVQSDGYFAPSVAALVNGTAAHAFELDDTHDESLSHPGSVIISAALAVAAESSPSEGDVLSAIACGYEAMTRLGIAANADSVITSGRHPTALFGPFGAAAAAARLKGFDASTLARTWGHVLSLTGGSMQFSDESEGTAIKRVHAGYAAQNGVLASELAARGVGAPTRALDGKYGFFKLFCEKPDLQRLVARENEKLQIHSISIKPYSCCRLFHSLIDGLSSATDEFSLDLRRIQKIHVRGPGLIFDQHMLRRPESEMAAQYSLPFVVGATLAYGPNRFDAYTKLHDEQILLLADRVEGSVDPTIEREYPAHLGTAVDLILTDGTKRSAKVMDSRGTPARPLDVDELQLKALGLIREQKPDVASSQVYERIWGVPLADGILLQSF